MTTDFGINYNNTYTVGNSGTATATTGVSANSTPVDVKAQSSSDTYVNNGTKETEKKTKRTLEELQTQLSALSKQLGIKDEETVTLVSRVAGYNKNELLNVEQDVLNKTIKSITEAIKDAERSEDNEKYIDNVAELAKDYNIALNTGWSIEGFKKYNGKNSENINQRLIRTLGLSKDFDIATCDETKRKDVLKKYFNLYFESLKKDPNYKNKDIHKLQLQDFGKLLINSTDPEQKAAMDALKELYSDNKLPGLEALIRSFNNEKDRTNCLDSLGYQTFTGPDAEGKFVSEDDSTKIAILKNELGSQEGIEKAHAELNNLAKEYYEEHKELLDNILSKKLNLEDLTPEEEKILAQFNQYIALQSGEIIGTANNTKVSTEDRDMLLSIMNKDAYKISKNNYREVFNKINQYTKEHKTELKMSKEDFDKLMNTLSKKNYSIIINDAKNGTKTELNTNNTNNNAVSNQTENKEKNNYATNPLSSNNDKSGCFTILNINYEAASKTVKAKTETLPYVLENNDINQNYKSCKDNLKIATTMEGRKQLIETYGKENYIKAAVTGTIIGAKHHALSLYENLSKDEQLNIWERADAMTKIELLYYSAPEVIMSMDKCSNEAINKLVEDEKESIKENNPELYKALTSNQA